MLKAALTHIVQQNKQEIKLGQLQSNQGHKQPFYLLKQSGNYFLSSPFVKPAMLYNSIQESI